MMTSDRAAGLRAAAPGLTHINRELKRLKTRMAVFEGRKSQLIAERGK